VAIRREYLPARRASNSGSRWSGSGFSWNREGPGRGQDRLEYPDAPLDPSPSGLHLSREFVEDPLLFPVLLVPVPRGVQGEGDEDTGDDDQPFLQIAS